MDPTGPKTHWTETRLQNLVPHEHDAQEFKGSLFVYEANTRVVRSDFADNLSKQISAFANAGGGHLFLGIDDNGQIDGGIPVDLRHNGTREWLEDILPGVVDPPLKRFNVYQVEAEDPANTLIHPDHAVFVVELPESEDAPHQSRDRRYYLRIAGKSRPMGHRHVLDILQRRRDPEVRVEHVDPYGQPELFPDDPRGPCVLLRMRVRLANRGRALAQHVGLECTLPRFAVNSECRRRTLVEQEGTLLQSPGEVTFFFYHPTPIFPKQQIAFGVVWIAIHATNLHHYTQGRVIFRWRIYADAAPTREGQLDVSTFSAVQRGIRLAKPLAKA